MAKSRRLKPLKSWSNRLVWAVWKISKNNKERAGGDVPPLELDNLVFSGDNIVFGGDQVVY